MNEQFQAQTAALQSSQRLVDQLSNQVAMLHQAVSQLTNQANAVTTAPAPAPVLTATAPAPVAPSASVAAALAPELLQLVVPVAKTGTWTYSAPPPKAETPGPTPLEAATVSWDASPPWSKSMATQAIDGTEGLKIPSLIVYRSQSLLPAARHHLNIIECDVIPDWFLTGPVQVDENQTLASALIGQRTAPAINWKLSPVPLGKASPDW